MPFKQGYKKSYPKQQRGRYSQYKACGTMVLSDAAKALAIARKVRGLINVEYHSLSTVFTVDPNTSGVALNLSAIAQGDTINNRQGNKLRVKHLEVGGIITLHASATNSQVRMMIVRDNNGSTTPPTISSLFANAATFFANRLKLGDPQTNSRFTVLWDRFIIMDAGHGLTQKFHWSTGLDHHVYFTGTSATDEGKGHMYLFIASNEATNDPVVAANATLKWIDN